MRRQSTVTAHLNMLMLFEFALKKTPQKTQGVHRMLRRANINPIVGVCWDLIRVNIPG